MENDDSNEIDSSICIALLSHTKCFYILSRFFVVPLNDIWSRAGGVLSLFLTVLEQALRAGAVIQVRRPSEIERG